MSASNGCERDACKGSMLSVLHEGAWADMLLVDGDPMQGIMSTRAAVGHSSRRERPWE